MAPSLAPALPLWEALVRLTLAAVLAGAIGIERELREQEAGLRTHMLVCVGATMFMIVGVYGWSDFQLSNSIGVVVDPRGSPRTSSRASASSARARSSGTASTCAG